MNKKYDRDFFDWHASPRPGRLGPRLLQYTPDAGDGTPGLQWMFRKMLEVLGQYFVTEGCEYSEDSGGKVTAGWIFFESKIVEVSEQTSVGVLSSLGDGYFIYINESGTAGNSNVNGTFISNVISSMREHSTTIDVRFKGHANKFVISHDLIVGKTVIIHGITDFYSAVDMNNNDIQKIKDLDVDGNIDAEGTMDVLGAVTFHGALSMSSTKITDLAAPTVANDAARKTYVDNLPLTGDLNGSTLANPQVVDDSHIHDTQYYTKTLLDGGQLDDRYFTETEADGRYFQKSEFLNSSAGVGDAGKPIKLDSGGKVDATMVNDGDISHLNIGDIGSNNHSQIDNHLSSTSNPHTVTLAQLTPGTADDDINMGSNKITNLASPTDIADAVRLQDIGMGNVSTNIVHASDIEQDTQNTNPTKVKEINCYKNLKSYRVKWTFFYSGSGDAYSRTYVNGVAVGTTRTISTPGDHVETEDLTNLYVGDKIQIYGWCDVDTTVYVKLMKIQYDEFTNNDP